MNSTRTDYMVDRNGWENILGRLDILAEEINRALNRGTGMEEPQRGIRIARSQDTLPHEKVHRHLILVEG